MSAKTEAEQTDRVRNQGREHGLFRACMDQIRTSHTIGQSLRHAALAAGLMTDAKCYAELLGQFYGATAALENRMEELLSKDDTSSALLVAKVKKLGYSFKLGYEQDLLALLGSDWKNIIQSWMTEPTKRYIQRMETATYVECAAAAFILHGPLIIGGGAMLKPRVEKAFGDDATHVFEDVIGTARGGRSSRRKDFIKLYDTLLDRKEDKESEASKEIASCEINSNSSDARFNAIVHTCGEFMQLNNEMMLAVRQAPWWRKYVKASLVAAASAAIWRVIAYYDAPSSSTRGTVSSNGTV